MNNHIDEKKYILSSRKIKKLDWNIECSDFHARVFDFKILEYNREKKKRKLYVKDHAHSFCEIQFVIRGRNTYCINDSMISVSGGEFLVICPGVKHRLVDFTNEFLFALRLFSVKNLSSPFWEKCFRAEVFLPAFPMTLFLNPCGIFLRILNDVRMPPGTR